MFNFTPPQAPVGPMPFNAAQALAAFRPPGQMSMGAPPTMGSMQAPGASGMNMPQQQRAPDLGALQQGGLALANALGHRPGDGQMLQPGNPSYGDLGGTGFQPAYQFLGGGSASP